jgi:hypothetical protein
VESCCLHFHDRKWRKQVPSKDWYGTISENKAILHFSVTYFLSYGLEFLWGQLVRHAVKNISICLVFQSSEMLCHIPSCSILELPAVPSLAFITEKFLSSWMWCHITCCSILELPVIPVLIFIITKTFLSSKTWCHTTCYSVLELPAVSVLTFITMRTSNIIHNYFLFQMTIWRDGFEITAHNTSRISILSTYIL